MATKKSATKKTTAKKSGAKKTNTTTIKATTSKARASKLPVGVVYESNPEDHKVTGKYTFFYILFACTTFIFAGISTWLFIFSSQLLAKYESIEACARNNYNTCEIRYVENAEDIDDTDDTSVEE